MKLPIHRAAMSGGARCQASGPLKLSTSGVGATCPDCVALDKPAPSVQEWFAARRAQEASPTFRGTRTL